MIYLRPCSGLCNRLRAMNAAYWLSKHVHTGLKVFWRIDDSMNTGFTSLFEPPDGTTVVDHSVRQIIPRIIFHRFNPLAYSHATSLQFVDNAIKTKGCLPLSITEYSEFFTEGESRYVWLKPKSKILEIIESYHGEIGDDAIGVHIRRTDNEMATRYSPLELFISRMDVALEKSPGLRFFLATDDCTIKQTLLVRYGKAVYTRDKVSARDHKNGVVDAVVDLFLLAGCKRGILGSYWSSFSEVAATIGWVPYQQVKTKDAPPSNSPMRVDSSFGNGL